MGVNLPRPIGTKAAKAELSTSSEVNMYMDRIIANNGKMQQKLDNIASTSSKKLELIQRSVEVNEMTQLRKSYKFLKKMGDTGAAQESYDRMRQIMRSEQKPRSFVQTLSPPIGQSEVTVASSYNELIGQDIPGSAFIRCSPSAFIFSPSAYNVRFY
ncbi:hypothetical protein IV203_009016 [Nitzschia inconspicua]|uniref:Uncharacterized protein n=1 Tax=Nitzschia inconspicua TaxID=303405 RepID=A0A9K3L132_9STRA|nr:hypothetical protein IV203_009016 [Nitzschia inconspicua]